VTSVYIVLPAGGGEQQSLTPPLYYVLTAAAAAAGCYTCVLAVSQVLVDAGEEATLIVACTHTQHCMRVFIIISTGVFFFFSGNVDDDFVKKDFFFFWQLGRFTRG
jgi:hypothetical protein